MWQIIFQNQDVVAINKPAGIAVHQEEGAVHLVHSLAEQLGIERVWLLHRLDKATSGILLFALHHQAASDLSQQFADKSMRKTYVALGEGKPLKKQGWIKGDMAKSRRGSWKLLRSTENPAVTYFQSYAGAAGRRVFMLQPHTGKTHQLRVAMKSLGCPIVGDERYGGQKAERMFLHAWRLAFEYKGVHFNLIAPLGKEWPSETEDFLHSFVNAN